jgi:hypothetical protein
MKRILTFTILIWCIANLLNAQIELRTDNVVDIGSVQAPLIRATPSDNTVQIGNQNGTVNIGNQSGTTVNIGNPTAPLIKVNPNNTVDIGINTQLKVNSNNVSIGTLATFNQSNNSVRIGNRYGIVTIGGSPLGNTLTSQIEINPNTGIISIGNLPGLVPGSGMGTRVEVSEPKVVIKNSTLTGFQTSRQLGVQFFPSTDSRKDPNLGLVVYTDVMALAGLDNEEASVGRWDNTMHMVYSKYFHASGEYLGMTCGSDARLKTNIRELSPMTERISRLRPVMYDFVRTGSGEDVSENPAYQNRVGFIAQEVQELFPDLVVAVGEQEILSIDYAGLIPYLTKTIQEQTIAIREQREMIERLQQQINFAAAFDIDMPNNAPQQTPTPSSTMQTPTENNILFQNVPNPFNSVTTINYRLGDNVKTAKICIYNLTGKQLQCYNLPATSGENTIEVRASSLQSGMYLYSLIVDGRLIDTKRMILTD